MSKRRRGARSRFSRASAYRGLAPTGGRTARQVDAHGVTGIPEGHEVDVLASVDGAPVLVRQGAVLAAAFHPELSGDLRLHQLFLEGV